MRCSGYDRLQHFPKLYATNPMCTFSLAGSRGGRPRQGLGCPQAGPSGVQGRQRPRQGLGCPQAGPSGVQGRPPQAGFGVSPGRAKRGPGAAAPGRVWGVPRQGQAGSRGGSPRRGLGCPKILSPPTPPQAAGQEKKRLKHLLSRIHGIY